MIDGPSQTQDNHISDERLAVLALENPDYYGQLMQRYEAPLMRYIRRLTNLVPETVEDILQESYIKAYRNLASFDSSLKFSSWIYRIVHNETMSYLRKVKVRPQVLLGDLGEDALNRLRAESVLESSIDHKQMAEILNTAIAHLKPDYQQAFILKFIEGKDYIEISDILRKPMGTIATLINRAKKQLRDELSKKGITYGNY